MKKAMTIAALAIIFACSSGSKTDSDIVELGTFLSNHCSEVFEGEFTIDECIDEVLGGTCCLDKHPRFHPMNENYPVEFCEGPEAEEE